MSKFRLTLFGTPQLFKDGRLLRLQTRKCMALLAFLALNDHYQSRELLATMFWSEQNEKHSRASLRRALSVIRSALGPDLLRTHGSLVRLRQDPSLTIDILEYHSLADPCIAPTDDSLGIASCIRPLAQAAEQYTADFLAGFTLPDCPEFDEWQFFQAENLRGTLVHVLQILIYWQSIKQDYELAIKYARRWLAQDRLHEPAQRKLMELYALSGQYAAAMRQYEECVRVLDDELGVAPEEETKKLYQDIRHRRLESAHESQQEAITHSVTGSYTDIPTESETGWEPKNNIPVQPTPFVGREEELLDILGRLQDPECHLLTLVAPGGMGKTRVAIEVANRLLRTTPSEHSFCDGIFFVPLQPVNTVDGIVIAVADAMHFTFYRDVSPKDQLLDYLHDKQMLLVLDNFEQLLDGAAILTDMLEAASQLKILVTSREGLRLRQEWFHPLAGMQFARGPTAENQKVSDFDAVKLFEQVAHRVQPDFHLNDEQDNVVRICRLMDGMPLGIELASAWTKVLSCAQIADEIERGLDILVSRNRDILERHRSMRVMLDYTFSMLTEDEQQALRRLSVFRGGLTLDSAEKVTSTSLLTLASLVEKSLLHKTDEDRYQIHELLRQYGVEKLSERSVEEVQIRDKHASYYCGFVASHCEGLKHSQQQHVLAELEVEKGNIRLAWHRATSRLHLEQIEEAMDGLGLFYEWKGELVDGLTSFKLITGAEDITSNRKLQQVRAHAQAWTAEFEFMSGHLDAAEEQLAQCMDTLHGLESAGEDVRWTKALALLRKGYLEQPHDLDRAVRAYRQSYEYFDELGCRWEAATAQAWLGETEREIGRTRDAISLLRSAQTVFEEFGDQRSVAMVLENIARAYLLDQAELDIALVTAQRSLELRRQSGDRVGIATTLLVVSYVYCWLNQPLEARPLMEEALEIAKDLGHRPIECEAYYIASTVYNYLENREKKREVGERGYALARELGDVRLMSDFLRSLGTQVMINGDIVTAHQMHVKAFEVQEQAGIVTMLPWLHVMRAYSSWKLGYFEESRTHTKYALEAIIEHSDLYTVVHTLLFLAQVLAVSGDAERAVEIGSAARAVSRWDKSLTGRMVFVEPFEKLTESLSPEATEAAKERGQDSNVFEVAKELLQEIQGSSWRWN